MEFLQYKLVGVNNENKREKGRKRPHTCSMTCNWCQILEEWCKHDMPITYCVTCTPFCEHGLLYYQCHPCEMELFTYEAIRNFDLVAESQSKESFYDTDYGKLHMADMKEASYCHCNAEPCFCTKKNRPYQKEARNKDRKIYKKKYQARNSNSPQQEIEWLGRALEYKGWTQHKDHELLVICFRSYITSGLLPQYEYVRRQHVLGKKFTTVKTGVVDRKLVLQGFLKQAQMKGVFNFSDVHEAISQSKDPKKKGMLNCV